MKITRISQITGIAHTLDIDVTQDQLDAWSNGALIQDAMPNVSAADREFIMSGITAQEWNDVMGDPE